MAEYRRGVLIHNFNEDEFGRELVKRGRILPPTPPSITHSAFQDPRSYYSDYSSTGGSSLSTGSWSTGSPNSTAASVESIRSSGERIQTTGLQAPLLFGHCGNISNGTRGLRQKAFVTSTQYFHQRPEAALALIASGATGNGKPCNPWHCEKFYEGSHALEVARNFGPSVLAETARRNWENLKDPYASIYTKTMGNKEDPTMGLETNRIPRVCGEFTKKLDAVYIKRTVF
ncbi:unnamed protein product [Amoebophrya sp. A25]|nr:unnamed protein product [Amoebophrya sp. A25]|eukprot:GSA25T00019763001.1